MGREGEAEVGELGAIRGKLGQAALQLSHACVGVVPLCLCLSFCVCVCVCLGVVGSSRRAWSKQKTVNYVITLKNMAVSMVRKVFAQII